MFDAELWRCNDQTGRSADSVHLQTTTTQMVLPTRYNQALRAATELAAKPRSPAGSRSTAPARGDVGLHVLQPTHLAGLEVRHNNCRRGEQHRDGRRASRAPRQQQPQPPPAPPPQEEEEGQHSGVSTPGQEQGGGTLLSWSGTCMRQAVEAAYEIAMEGIAEGMNRKRAAAEQSNAAPRSEVCADGGEGHGA